MKRLPTSLMAAALGMSIAVSVLCLFAASVTEIIPLSAVCLFFASLMTWIPVREEHGYIFAAIKFTAVTAISLIICPGIYTYLYILIFGNYAPLRLFLRTRLDDRFLTVLLRMLYFNLLVCIGLAVTQFILHYDVMMFIPGIPVYIPVAALEVGFIVYMLLYKFFSYLFDSALRNKLMPRR